ncbi:hypothetical protein EDC04DRAFT_2901463 [Pisolithus marmoratus]|nr:hypothetical protein EDC04DRAFT_2901463 [Pisolithus marmoratus]
MPPLLIIPLILSSAQKFKVWIANRRQQRESEHDEAEAITLAVMDRSENKKAVSAQTMIEDIEASLRHNGHPLSSEE